MLFNTITAIVFTVFIFANSNYSIDRPILRVRNQYLRMYILHKGTKESFNKQKYMITNFILFTSNSIKDRTTRTYNSVLSKYYDANMAYYSLSQDDRELIEQIINLHF